jgi:nitrogenase-associated protein
MAKIIFYEKTGCINNTKQKRILELVGYELEAIDIIAYKWSAAELKAFFENVPLEKWFNMNALTISFGEDSPNNYNKDTAIDAMLKNHLLIKRPLMIVNGEKLVGFDKAKIDEELGL